MYCFFILSNYVMKFEPIDVLEVKHLYSMFEYHNKHASVHTFY